MSKAFGDNQAWHLQKIGRPALLQSPYKPVQSSKAGDRRVKDFVLRGIAYKRFFTLNIKSGNQIKRSVHIRVHPWLNKPISRVF